jgi:hypothetical protein
MPLEEYVTWPGFLRAWSTSCSMVLGANALEATSTLGTLVTRAIGARSFAGEYCICFLWTKALMAVSPAEPMSSVYPSGVPLATARAPIMPLAPGLLSTMTFCFSDARNSSASRRAIVSTPPPAENGTTMVIVRPG